MKSYLKFLSPIGDLYLIEEAGELLSIGTKRDIFTCADALTLLNYPNALKQAGRFLSEYFSGRASAVKIPLKLEGSTFFKTTLLECSKIPYGKTMTYKELGDRVKERLRMKGISYQAVGTALSHNPFLIYIPCHRVNKSDKSIGEYREGQDIKRKLLEGEGIII